MELYIIRHGETVWNKEKRLQGRSDIEINENGRDIAIRTGNGIKDIHFDAVYASPLRRAYETAKLICKGRDIDIFTDERLKEISFGSYEGKTYDELESLGIRFNLFFDRPEQYIPVSDAEDFDSLIKRAKGFLEELVRIYGGTDKRIMIVAHGAINKAIMLNIKNIKIKDFWSGGLQNNCSAMIVSYKNGKFNILNEGKLFY